ncbi:MAG TPA: TIM44-like domain-containing protein [Burkholderiales bacterium]|nr:TIM44-like domain-containing protein [Burkholderiales bacterium]
MKKLLSALAVMFGFAMVAVDTEAARVGGGRSSGRQSNSATNQAAPAQKTAPAQQATPPAAQPSGMSRWLGPLAGLAAGFGIAALLSSMGLGGALASALSGILMVMLLLGAGYFIYRMLTRNKTAAQAPLQYAGAGNRSAPAPVQQPAQFTGNAAPGSLAATLGGTAAAPSATAGRWPADFDVVEFERQALLNFERVQAANDAGDAATLRDFLTPELYRELEGEMKAAWGTPQKTEAVGVKSEVLEVITEGDLYVVSVRFTGQVRENGTLNNLNEIWHLEKPVSGRSGWRVSGIQQAS